MTVGTNLRKESPGGGFETNIRKESTPPNVSEPFLVILIYWDQQLTENQRKDETNIFKFRESPQNLETRNQYIKKKMPIY